MGRYLWTRPAARASVRPDGSCNARLYRLLPALIITEAQVGEIAACCAQALPDTQTRVDAGTPTEINTSTSSRPGPDLRHLLAGFHTLGRSPLPIPRRPRRPGAEKSPTLSHFLPLKKLLIKDGVLLRRSVGAIQLYSLANP